MQLVTFRRGRGETKLGAVWHERVLDLGGLYKDQAAQRGTLRRGRGGFPRSLLEVIQGGEATWASVREVWEYGKGLVDQQAIEELATRLRTTRSTSPSPARRWWAPATTSSTTPSPRSWTTRSSSRS